MIIHLIKRREWNYLGLRLFLISAHFMLNPFEKMKTKKGDVMTRLKEAMDQTVQAWFDL
jgi:hypothetical protein